MPPNSASTVKCTGILNEKDAETIDGGLTDDIEPLKHASDRKIIPVWHKIIGFAYIHVGAVYGIWLAVTSARIYTSIFALFLYVIGMIGITAGAHRLWAHRSYKANTPLKIILIIFNTIAFQDCVIRWARDHRVHHKYSETDADPYNAMRGFFFSHIGWLLCRKHPEVYAKGQKLDISDLESDPILRFQRKYYIYLMPVACFILPTIIPMYGWNESFRNAWFVAAIFRWAFSSNSTWLVNSAAHKWGGRPYDKIQHPAENPSVSLFTLGEGWHNYHHVFPWDYKTDEFGKYRLNLSTAFIDFFSKIGWAYDLKSVPSDVIEKRVKRTGDGTHSTWGWGDQDDVEMTHAHITNRKDD